MNNLFNSPTIYIVGGFALLSILYYIIVLPRIKANIQKKGQALKETFAGQEEEIKNSLFSTILRPIIEAIGTSNLTGIVECMQKRTTGDLITQAAVNTAGKVVGGITGVGFEMTDNNHCYYLAINNSDLYYIVMDDEKCLERMIYPLNQLSDIELAKGGVLDQNIKGGAAGAEKISFSFENSKHTIYYYKYINYLPDRNRPTNEDFAKINLLLSEPFAQKINALKS